MHLISLYVFVKDEAFEMIREADTNGDNKVSFSGKINYRFFKFSKYKIRFFN